MDAAEDGRCQLDGREGVAQFFVGEVGGEELSLSHHDSLYRIEAGDDVVGGVVSRHGPGVGDNGLTIFHGAEAAQFQPGRSGVGFEVLTGDQHDAETACLKFLSYRDEGMHIARAAGRAQQGCLYRGHIIISSLIRKRPEPTWFMRAYLEVAWLV